MTKITYTYNITEKGDVEVSKDDKRAISEIILSSLANKYGEITLIPAQERQGKRNLAADTVDLTQYGITGVSYIDENGNVVQIPGIHLKKAPIV